MLSFAAALSLTIGAAGEEPPVKIVATIAVEGALTEIEPLLAARAGRAVDVEFATTAALVDGFAGASLREGKVAAAVQQISELKFTGAGNIVPLFE